MKVGDFNFAIIEEISGLGRKITEISFLEKCPVFPLCMHFASSCYSCKNSPKDAYN